MHRVSRSAIQVFQAKWTITDTLLARYVNPLFKFRQITSETVARPNSDEWTDVKNISEIPTYNSLPILGNTLAVLLHKDFDRARLYRLWVAARKELGPTFRFDILGVPPFVAFTKPEDIEDVFRSTMVNPVRMGLDSLKKVREENPTFFGGKGGIMVEQNDEWWRVRSRVQTPMMKPKNIHRYLSQMDEVALDFMDRIPTLLDDNKEVPDSFINELYKWAFESVSLVALNTRLGCLDPNISPDSRPFKMIAAANELFITMNDTELGIPIWKLFPTKSFKNLRRVHKLFVELADTCIREAEQVLEENKRKGLTEEPTLMETLLGREGLTRTDVVTMMVDMLFAGIDTTSHTLGFTLYLLAKNPKVQKKLQAEVDDVMEGHEGPLLPSQLSKVSYLKACVKESLRLFPLAPGVARILERDTVIGGYMIPKGCGVFGLSLISGWDESIFSKAKQYIPERWSRDQPLGPIHPYASLPFSHGTRMCIGRRIAEQEIYTFLVRVMQRYSMEYHYQDVDIVNKLVFAPSEPLKFRFLERNANK